MGLEVFQISEYLHRPMGLSIPNVKIHFISNWGWNLRPYVPGKGSTVNFQYTCSTYKLLLQIDERQIFQQKNGKSEHLLDKKEIQMINTLTQRCSV